MLRLSAQRVCFDSLSWGRNQLAAVGLRVLTLQSALENPFSNFLDHVPRTLEGWQELLLL